MQIIECIPNFSEGRNTEVIERIAQSIRNIEGVKLLDVDPGAATNRTVMTFVGEPKAVLDAAISAMKAAKENIDMTKHEGEHPRMGSMDVCPLVPIANITMEEVVTYAHELGERAATEVGICGYYYEYAATSNERKNLATVRSGEYEGLAEKLKKPQWVPDFGKPDFDPHYGATAISARDFLVAYNVNLNTTSVRRANSVAFDVREKGRVKREGHPVMGKILRDTDGEPLRIPGSCKSVKAIGWYIEEYGMAQISMNLTNINHTSLHEAFEACRVSARSRGLRVTGSELVGLVPKQVMLAAGRYYLKLQERSDGLPDEEIIRIAVKSMGLDELGEFNIRKKVIEFAMEDESARPLINSSLADFANETASESVAPGGGSVAAYVGALGGALATMVANLTAHKRGYDEKWQYFSEKASEGQSIQYQLQRLVDDDTAAFNAIIDAVRMPKSTEDEKAKRSSAMKEATKLAINVPFDVMQTAMRIFPLAEAMIVEGNPNSVSDAGVAALCARAAVMGAYMNVMINCTDFDDAEFVDVITEKAESIKKEALIQEERLTKMVLETI